MAEGAGTASIRNRIASVDLRVQLPDEFLFMQDRFSMAHSLEARSPFLDRRFVEQMLQIDPQVRVDHDKTLFREAMGYLIPETVKNNRKKGFILPESQWLREKLRDEVEELFSEKYIVDQGIWNPAIRHKIVQPHLKGIADNGWQLWTLFMFQQWYHHCRHEPI